MGLTDSVGAVALPGSRAVRRARFAVAVKLVYAALLTCSRVKPALDA